MSFSAADYGACQFLSHRIYKSPRPICFYPFSQGEPTTSLIVGRVVVVTNAISAVFGREINRRQTFSPMTVTLVSMGVGSRALLAMGISLHGLLTIHKNWAFIGVIDQGFVVLPI
jgi:hypothetical protein